MAFGNNHLNAWALGNQLERIQDEIAWLSFEDASDSSQYGGWGSAWFHHLLDNASSRYFSGRNWPLVMNASSSHATVPVYSFPDFSPTWWCATIHNSGGTNYPTKLPNSINNTHCSPSTQPPARNAKIQPKEMIEQLKLLTRTKISPNLRTSQPSCLSKI